MIAKIFTSGEVFLRSFFYDTYMLSEVSLSATELEESETSKRNITDQSDRLLSGLGNRGN